MSRTFTREDTRRLAAILAETAQTEVMPRFRNLPEGTVRGKSSPRDLVTDATRPPSASSPRASPSCTQAPC